MTWAYPAEEFLRMFTLPPAMPKDATKEIKINLDNAVLGLLPQSLWDLFVLDVGAGCGVMAKKLEERHAFVTLLDSDLFQLMLARAWIGASSRVSYLCGDAAAQLQGRFHFAVCQEVLEHLLYPDRCVQAVMDSLLPGGTAIFSAPHVTTEGHDDFEANKDRPKPVLTIGGPAYTYDHLRTYTTDQFVKFLAEFGKVEEFKVVSGKDDKGLLHSSVVATARRQ